MTRNMTSLEGAIQDRDLPEISKNTFLHPGSFPGRIGYGSRGGS
jgi:hypothetical protein